MLTPELAAALSRVALANVVRAYPHKLDHLISAAGGQLEPRVLHPAFYGSYDWHSAVHMHWLLARCLRVHPGLPGVNAVMDSHLSPQCIEAELRYFKSPAGRTFERPYGWAWLLELQAELARLAGGWTVAPLATELAARFADFIDAAPYPVRAGSHGNTAFACVLALDHANVANDSGLRQSIGAAARRWYAADRDAPLAYEPSLDDFLSPALVEALLMKQVLAEDEFSLWLKRFLPRDLGPLARPPLVADHADAKQSHLDGLCLSRAWCFKRLGFEREAEHHLAAGMPHVTGGAYAGEHWLASFAVLALSAAALRTP